MLSRALTLVAALALIAARADQRPPAARVTTPTVPPSAPSHGIGDYDCAGGSGNGPNYVHGPLKVLPPDPFGLDRDGDGIGCE